MSLMRQEDSQSTKYLTCINTSTWKQFELYQTRTCKNTSIRKSLSNTSFGDKNKTMSVNDKKTFEIVWPHSKLDEYIRLVA